MVYDKSTDYMEMYLNQVRDPTFDGESNRNAGEDTNSDPNIAVYSQRGIGIQHKPFQTYGRHNCPKIKCSSYADCVGPRTLAGCEGIDCFVDRIEPSPWRGLGSCLINSVGKRSLEGSGEWQCACNASYASVRCCGVESGLVYEDLHPRVKRYHA